MDTKNIIALRVQYQKEQDKPCTDLQGNFTKDYVMWLELKIWSFNKPEFSQNRRTKNQSS